MSCCHPSHRGPHLPPQSPSPTTFSSNGASSSSCFSVGSPRPFWGPQAPCQEPSGPKRGSWRPGGVRESVAARGRHRPWEGGWTGAGFSSSGHTWPQDKGCCDPSLCMMGRSQPRATPLRPRRCLAAHRPLLLLARDACSPARWPGWWGFGRGPPVLPGFRGAGSVPRGLEGQEEPPCQGEAAVGGGWPVLWRGGDAWGRGAGVSPPAAPGAGTAHGHLPGQRHPETGSWPPP